MEAFRYLQVVLDVQSKRADSHIGLTKALFPSSGTSQNLTKAPFFKELKMSKRAGKCRAE